MGNNSKKERKEETDKEQEETGEEGEKSTAEKNIEEKKKIQTEQPKGSSEQKQKDKVPAYTPIVPFPQRLHKEKGKSNFYIFEHFQEDRNKYPFCKSYQLNA